MGREHMHRNICFIEPTVNKAALISSGNAYIQVTIATINTILYHII